MILPNDYDSAKAYDGQGFNALPIGPHVCRISGAKLEKSRNGNDMIAVAFDIAEGGPNDGYYMELYNRKRGYNVEAKWPGTFRTALLNKDGKTSGYFKGLITSIEESNADYNFRAAGCDENTLKGKLIAFNFGEEEWRKNDGTVAVSVKPFYAISVKTARDGIDPPQRKALNDNQAQMERRGFKPVDDTDDDLPF